MRPSSYKGVQGTKIGEDDRVGQSIVPTIIHHANLTCNHESAIPRADRRSGTVFQAGKRDGVSYSIAIRTVKPSQGLIGIYEREAVVVFRLAAYSPLQERDAQSSVVRYTFTVMDLRIYSLPVCRRTT